MVVVAWLTVMMSKRRGEHGSGWTGNGNGNVGSEKRIKVIDEHFFVAAAATRTLIVAFQLGGREIGRVWEMNRSWSFWDGFARWQSEDDSDL